MKDAELELLLKVRRQHPEEWEALDPSVKLEALNFEARGRDQEVLNEEERKAARPT